MTPTQADIDFKPIKTRFPRSTMNRDGLPCILSNLEDPDRTISWQEGDPLGLQFDIEDGFRVTIDTYHLPFLALPLDLLEKITNRARVAEGLFKNWQETPTGKAWAEKNSQ